MWRPKVLSSLQGFTVIESVVAIIVIAIILVVVIPAYHSISGNGNVTASVAGALNDASANNHLLSKLGSSRASNINNCTQIANLLPAAAQLPSGYAINSQTLSRGSSATCTVTNPDGVTRADFVGWGV